MSKADEMFNNWNFIEEYYDRNGTLTNKEKCEVLVYAEYYDNEINTQIEFYLLDKYIGIQGLINLKLLQAINEKVKELGWLDE